MSSESKRNSSLEAAREHAQAHLEASVQSSGDTEIMKGTYTFPDRPDGSGMVRDPDSGCVLFIGILVHRLTLRDGGYMLIGANADSGHADNVRRYGADEEYCEIFSEEEQVLHHIVRGLFRHMLNRPLMELNTLTPESLCEILNIQPDAVNIRSCSFVLLGFRQAFSQYLQRE